MDLLTQLREAPVPRPEPVARAVARRLDGPLAMVLYGVLYFMFAANYVLLAAGYGLLVLGRHVLGSPLPGWYFAAAGAVLLAVLWLAFWPFRWWKRRRVTPALALGRSGELLSGEIAEWRRRGRLAYAVVWFAHGGQEHAIQEGTSAGLTPDEHPVGARIPVLYTPASRRALYFTRDGRGASSRVLHKPAGDALLAAGAR